MRTASHKRQIEIAQKTVLQRRTLNFKEESCSNILISKCASEHEQYSKPLSTENDDGRHETDEGPLGLKQWSARSKTYGMFRNFIFGDVLGVELNTKLGSSRTCEKFGTFLNTGSGIQN